jgi:beta-glucanase (GH16 family)
LFHVEFEKENMRSVALYFIVLSLAALSGCGEDDPKQTVKLPSNLVMTIANDANSGKVRVTASATDANYLMVFFGEDANETGTLASNGVAEHTYATAKTYTIRVQAHSTAIDFISESEDVTITLPIPGAVVIPSTGATSPLTYDGLDLVWQDEFDGTSVNSSNWTFETGGHGWGNNELQYYRPENTKIQDGHLVITAKKESFMERDYTSSRMITKGKKEFQYGRIDIRASLPKGQGIWPALWMLGSNFGTVSWPACGEIDIMEMIGGAGRENTVHGTIHWQNAGQYAMYGKPFTLAAGNFNTKFFVFSIVWTETSIKWYVDNVLFNTVDITPADLSEFRQEYFLIFNVAVGGNWPGNPDATTTFPQHMIVDYVRVFQ